jgi:hypothetical protein
VLAAAKNAFGRDAKVPVSLLDHRIRFTEQVDRALGDSTLEAVAADIRKQRAVCILKFRSLQSAADHLEQSALATMFKEQLDVLADLAASETPAPLWKAECRFYRVESDTPVVCRCGDLEHAVGERFQAQEVLVCTPQTREFRRTYLAACCSPGQLLFVNGPDGTGKTESAVDTAHMLGIGSTVFKCGDGLTPEVVADTLRDADPSSPAIFYCFGTLSPDDQTAIVAAAGEKRFVVCTCNLDAAAASKVPPTISGRKLVFHTMERLQLLRIFQVDKSQPETRNPHS